MNRQQLMPHQVLLAFLDFSSLNLLIPVFKHAETRPLSKFFNYRLLIKEVGGNKITCFFSDRREEQY